MLGSACAWLLSRLRPPFRRARQVKLEQARQSLGGQVFDVLGKLQFEGQSLRDLLINAIRYGERPEVRAKLPDSGGQTSRALEGT